MSEVQTAEDAVKPSESPSPAQDASKAEPSISAASQPSGDLPVKGSQSTSEPEALKKADVTPILEPPTNGMDGDKPASQTQTKPDSPVDTASPKPVSDVPTTQLAEEKQAAKPEPELSPMAKPDSTSQLPESAPNTKTDAEMSPKLTADPAVLSAEVSPGPGSATQPAVKTSPKASPGPGAAAEPAAEPSYPKASPGPGAAAEPAAEPSSPEASPGPGAAAEPAGEPASPEASPGPGAAAEPAAEPSSPEASRDSPPPAADSGQDDSGCDMEPEPLPAGPASMAEPRGPAMADVEQLARSVVTDTLERAKQEASMQRQLDNQRSDPDVDDDGWLDVVGNGQLKKKVMTAGSGDRSSRPQRSQVLTVHLSARFEDGRPATGLPERLTFGLGDGEVVTGLDMAVGLMQPGETAEVFMAARFAYGEKGLDDVIPPDTSLTFTVQLEDVKPEPKYEEMSAEERLAIGSQKRDRGNWWFKRDDFNHAIQCYRRALDFFDNESDEFTGLPDDVHVLFEERLKVHNNMAAAQMKLEAYDAALRSVQLVLTCQPDNVKALYRKGKILVAQKKVTEAAEALREALSHSPDNRTVQAELNRVLAEQRRQAEEQKSLYRKMLGLPPAEDKPAPATPATSFPVKLVVCGVACALAAAAVSRLKLF